MALRRSFVADEDEVVQDVDGAWGYEKSSRRKKSDVGRGKVL